MVLYWIEMRVPGTQQLTPFEIGEDYYKLKLNPSIWSNNRLLSGFLGMLTESKSAPSWVIGPTHDVFDSFP